MNESARRKRQRDEMLWKVRLSAGMAGAVPPGEPAPFMGEDGLSLAKSEQVIEDWYRSGKPWPEDESSGARTLHPIQWRSGHGEPWSDRKP